MKELLEITKRIIHEENEGEKKQLIAYLHQLLLGKISSTKKEKERKKYLLLLDLLKEGKIKKMQEKLHSYQKKESSSFPWWLFPLILLLLFLLAIFLFGSKLF